MNYGLRTTSISNLRHDIMARTLLEQLAGTFQTRDCGNAMLRSTAGNQQPESVKSTSQAVFFPHPLKNPTVTLATAALGNSVGVFIVEAVGPAADTMLPSPKLPRAGGVLAPA